MARRRLPPLGAGRDHIDLTPAASRCQPDAGQILPLAQSLLRSPECRLPLTGISRDLATTLDCALAALHEIPTLTDATLG